MLYVLQLMLKCSSREQVPALVAQVYTNHCTDVSDKLAVKSLVETLARYATVAPSEVNSTAASLLQQIECKGRPKDVGLNFKTIILSCHNIMVQRRNLLNTSTESQL